MRRRANLAFLLVVATAAACGARSSAETDPDKTAEGPDTVKRDQLVRIYLLSDVSAISAGQELRLALRFDVEPSWHIYWKNPGDAGLPTKVTFEVPDGFRVGETQYPGPSSFDAGEGIVSFGYHDLVLLSAPVIAPDTLGSSKVELTARASWLACREECIPGEGVATMTLDVAGAQIPSRPTNEAMFASHDAALPVPLAADHGTVAWTGDGNRTLEMRLPGATKAEYFPSVPEQTTLAGQLAVPGEDGVTLVLSYKAGAAAAARGVLAATRDGKTQYITLDESAAPSTPDAQETP